MKFLLPIVVILLFSCEDFRDRGECGGGVEQQGFCGMPKCEVHTYGEKLFKANCSSCHRYTDQKLVASGLSKYSNNIKAMRKDFKHNCQQKKMPVTVAEVDSITLYVGEMQLN